MSNLPKEQVKPTDQVKTWGRMTLVGLDESGNEIYWHVHYGQFFCLKKDPVVHVGGTGVFEYFVQRDLETYDFDPVILERINGS